jgi:predicted transcriptional regulator
MKNNKGGNVKEIRISATKDKLLETKLKIVNGILGLTPKELEVLEVLVALNPTIPAKTEDRVKAVKMLKLNSVQSLNNLIISLRRKNVILRNRENTHYIYHPIIPTNKSTDTFFIHVNLKDGD